MSRCESYIIGTRPLLSLISPHDDHMREFPLSYHNILPLSILPNAIASLPSLLDSTSKPDILRAPLPTLLSPATSSMSTSTTPRASAATSDPASVKSSGAEETKVNPSSNTENMAITPASKRKATSPAPTPAKVARVAPSSTAPELHDKDRGVAIEKDRDDTDAEAAKNQESQEHPARRILPLKRAPRLSNSDHHQSQPDSTAPKDILAAGAGADNPPLEKITSEEASKEAVSINIPEAKDKLTGDPDVALSMPVELEANSAACLEGTELPFPSTEQDHNGPTQDPSSTSPLPKPRISPRPKSSLFMKKSNRVQKRIAARAPQSLDKDVAEVNVIAAEDAIVTEEVGIVAAKAQRGNTGNAAYFAKAADGPSTSGRLRQTDDGDLKLRKRR